MTKLSDIPEDKDVMVHRRGNKNAWRISKSNVLKRLAECDDTVVHELVHSDIKFTAKDIAHWLTVYSYHTLEAKLQDMRLSSEKEKEIIKRLGRKKLNAIAKELSDLVNSNDIFVEPSEEVIDISEELEALHSKRLIEEKTKPVVQKCVEAINDYAEAMGIACVDTLKQVTSMLKEKT